MAVSTLADLQTMADRAASLGAGHGPITQGHHGWACDIADPDGIFVRLYTNERHA